MQPSRTLEHKVHCRCAHETNCRYAGIHIVCDYCISIRHRVLGSRSVCDILGFYASAVAVKRLVKKTGAETASKTTSKREFLAQVIQYMNMVEDLMSAYKAKPVELMRNFHKPTFQAKHKLLKKMVEEI